MYEQSLIKEIQSAAEEYLQKSDIVPLPVSGYTEYLKSGNRLIFEQAYFERRRQLAVMALAVYLDSKEESGDTLHLLEQIIWEICNEYTWALPAHLEEKARAFEDSAPQCIDLFAAETGQTLSEIYTLVGSRLSPLIVQRIHHEIERRIFLPLENRSWEWERKENNWSAVIAGCIGMTALSLLREDDPRLRHMIDRLDFAMQSYLRGFGEDGACVEGVGYWGYGFGYYIYYAEQLADYLKDDRYLTIPKVKAIASFPFLTQIDDQYVPFSDYSQSQLASGLINFCAAYFGTPEPMLAGVSPLDFDHCYRFAQLSRNLRWSKKASLNSAKDTVHHYFPDVQWVIIKEQKPPFFFAAKGGSNEESHNHLDVGHFVFGDRKTLFLTDLGAGEYTRDYFIEKERYNYFPTSAASHHLPVINGREQQSGAVAAENVSWQQGDRTTDFIMDLQATYSENAELRLFQRSFHVDGLQRKLMLTDHFVFDEVTNHVTERFVTMLKPLVTDENVLLRKDHQACELDLGTKDIQILEKNYIDHFGVEQKAYCIQAEYEVGQKADLRINIRLL